MNNNVKNDLSVETADEVYGEHTREELEKFIRQVVDKAICDIAQEFSKSLF